MRGSRQTPDSNRFSVGAKRERLLAATIDGRQRRLALSFIFHSLPLRENFARSSEVEETMRKLSIKLLGVVIISATLSSAISPAFALGGCGPNQHRNGWGQCVWGGQNEDWCLRTTGHRATRMPNGTLRCLH
jgi:hypothetical protein